jgi:hypothetical protein
MGWDETAVPHSDRMMWAAVLRRAVFDYVLYRGVRAHSLEWKRACQYVFSEGLRYDNGMSFEEVCDLFGWDAGYLRRLTTQFREDFVYDVVKVVVEQTEKWKTVNFAAPFLPQYKFNVQYRERMRPRVIRKETFIGSTMHMVQWQATA